MNLELFDTHCHIHTISSGGDDFTSKKWLEGGLNSAEGVIANASAVGVNRLICVGTNANDSERAVRFVKEKPNCWASVGIHPHDAEKYTNSPGKLQKIRNLLDEDAENLSKADETSRKIVAIGEIGLDYYYEHSPKKAQINLLEEFFDLATKYNLPVIFHVRDAHSEFWPILDNFSGVRGVMHSFSATTVELDQALERNLYVGLNGIMTFTRDAAQLEAAKAVPLQKLILETDAPYLTPKPNRGKVCQPANVADVAQFLAQHRDESIETLAVQTTSNACNLFGIG